MATVYVVVYFFLVAEMTLCALLLLPMPQKVRRLIFNALTSPLVKHQLRNASLVMFFVLMAFFLVDLNESWKFRSLAHQHRGQALNPTHLQEYWHDQAQYFRAQRNSYLSGFSIFILLILSRIIIVVSDLFVEQTKAEVLKKQAENNNKMLDGLMKENESLKKGAGSVDKAKVSEETLRKQSENNMKALDTLLTENKRLKQENDRLMNEATKKDPSVKKND